jgi:DNA-binding NtrC family response regulator
MANLKTLVSDYERQLIESALSATHGNQRRAAYSLGVLPTTLHEKMKRLGLMRREETDGLSGYAGAAQQAAR